MRASLGSLQAFPDTDPVDCRFFELLIFAPVAADIGDDVGRFLADEEAVPVDRGKVFELFVKAIVELFFRVEGGVH